MLFTYSRVKLMLLLKTRSGNSAMRLSCKNLHKGYIVEPLISSTV